ncbi:hypothetical protein HDU91_007185 [Kappamyces sp. JEL0680]|nr:hypothetical protein HDU91_007185 [Kappamyces sp. JEL0680]
MRSITVRKRDTVARALASSPRAGQHHPSPSASAAKPHSWKSHIFDGSTYTTSRTFTLADISFPETQTMVNSILYMRPDYHPKEGWYIDGHLHLIREKVKRSLVALMPESERPGSLSRKDLRKGAELEESDYLLDEDGAEDGLPGDAGGVIASFLDGIEDEDYFDILEED